MHAALDWGEDSDARRSRDPPVPLASPQLKGHTPCSPLRGSAQGLHTRVRSGRRCCRVGAAPHAGSGGVPGSGPETAPPGRARVCPPAKW